MARRVGSYSTRICWLQRCGRKGGRGSIVFVTGFGYGVLTGGLLRSGLANGGLNVSDVSTRGLKGSVVAAGGLVGSLVSPCKLGESGDPTRDCNGGGGGGRQSRGRIWGFSTLGGLHRSAGGLQGYCPWTVSSSTPNGRFTRSGDAINGLVGSEVVTIDSGLVGSGVVAREVERSAEATGKTRQLGYPI